MGNEEIPVEDQVHALFDPEAHLDSNCQHLLHFLIGYRMKVLNCEYIRPYSPGSARDISFQMGVKMAAKDIPLGGICRSKPNQFEDQRQAASYMIRLGRSLQQSNVPISEYISRKDNNQNFEIARHLIDCGKRIARSYESKRRCKCGRSIN